MENKKSLALSLIVEWTGWIIFFYALSHIIGAWTSVAIFGILLSMEGYWIGRKLNVYE